MTSLFEPPSSLQYFGMASLWFVACPQWTISAMFLFIWDDDPMFYRTTQTAILTIERARECIEEASAKSKIARLSLYYYRYQKLVSTVQQIVNVLTGILVLRPYMLFMSGLSGPATHGVLIAMAAFSRFRALLHMSVGDVSKVYQTPLWAMLSMCTLGVAIWFAFRDLVFMENLFAGTPIGQASLSDAVFLFCRMLALFFYYLIVEVPLAITISRGFHEIEEKKQNLKK